VRRRRKEAIVSPAGTGYLAYRNLFLSPGLNAERLGKHHFNWHIDMHGTETCNGHDFTCGMAGQFMDVGWNTVANPSQSPPQAVSEGVTLRGTPTDPRGMSVHDNVFVMGRDLAMTETVSGGLHDDGRNSFNVTRLWTIFANNDADPGGGTCDFDHDGVKDAFQATGATWWYFSSLVGHHVYLNLSSHGVLGKHTAPLRGQRSGRRRLGLEQMAKKTRWPTHGLARVVEHVVEPRQPLGQESREQLHARRVAQIETEYL